MKNYQQKEFNIVNLSGISEKQIQEHFGLYAGYVKHTNSIMEKIKSLSEDQENNSYLISEMRRRLGFEFDGMKMHELYFEQLEGGHTPINQDGDFAKGAIEKYGSVEGLIEHIEEVAKTRGIGWVAVCYDAGIDSLHTVWVSEHEIGHLAGCPVLLALDMWEHAFMVDYVPSQKKEYIQAFLQNINWSVVEERFRMLKL